MSRLAAQLVLCLAALALPKAGAVVVGSPLDVLYDRTDMTDNQTWNQVYVSSITLWNGGWDRQLADDFELFDSYTITTVTADLKDSLNVTIPGEGFLVEFFTDGVKCIDSPPPCPDEIPFAAAFVTSFVATTLKEIGENYHRYTLDLGDAGITLGPGSWWISVVAVDESGDEPSLDTYLILVTNDLPEGVPVAGRAGGEDHGNGYQGGTSSDWHPAFFEPGDQTPSDAAIRIEGTLVEPECPADLDDTGDVGVKDLLILLGVWGPCLPKGDCPADFDGSGDVGVKDLLVLLGVWGPCP